MKSIDPFPSPNIEYLLSRTVYPKESIPVFLSKPSSHEEIKIFHNMMISAERSLDRELWSSIYELIDSGFISFVNQSDLDSLIVSIYSLYFSEAEEPIAISSQDQQIRIQILNKILNESHVILNSSHIEQLFLILPHLFQNQIPLIDIYLLCLSLFKTCECNDLSLINQSLFYFYQSYNEHSIDIHFPRSIFCDCLGFLASNLHESLLPDFTFFSLPILLDTTLLSNWNYAMGCLTALSSLVNRFPPIRQIILSSSIFSLIPDIKPSAFQTFKHFSLLLFSLFNALKEENVEFFMNQNLENENLENENLENENIENKNLENENINNQNLENQNLENENINNQNLENQNFNNQNSKKNQNNNATIIRLIPDLLRPFSHCLIQSMEGLVVNILRMYGIASSYHPAFAEVVFDILGKINPLLNMEERSYIEKRAFIYMIHEIIFVLGDFSLYPLWENYATIIIETLDGDDVKTFKYSLEIIGCAIDHNLPMPDNLALDSFDTIMESDDEDIKVLAMKIIEIISS